MQVNLPPNAPEIYQADGGLNWENSTWINPMAALYNTLSQKTRNTIGNISINYNVASGLDFRTTAGYTNLDVNEIGKYPLIAVNPANQSTWERTAKYAFNRIQTWIAEPQLSYSKSFGKTDLGLLAGASVQESNTNNVLLGGTGYISDALLESVQAANEITTGGASVAQYRYIAGFGRANLNIAKRYLANLNFRRDGTTRFGPEKRFANFYSIGLGWIISEEELIKKNLPFISFSKLRGSYGTTGSDQIPDYSYLNLYEPAGNYQGGKGLAVSRIYNPELAWETNKKLEIGLELGFFKDRLLLSGSFYRNRPSDQLVDFSLTDVTGFSNVRLNWDVVIQNKGYEFTASSQVLKTERFKWQVSGNVSFQNNKLLEFPDLENSQFKDSYEIGKTINTIRLYQYAGVNPETGLYQFYDQNGALTSNPNYNDQKKVSLGTSYFGGLTNSFSYKSFALGFLFDFSRFKAIYSLTGYPGTANNFPEFLEDRWKKPGDIAKYQRAFATFGDPYFTQEFYNQSDGALLDTYWIKLRNISLSYNLSDALCRKLRIAGLQFNILAHNILTITNFKGPDPEVRSYYNTPTVFRVTGGMKLTF